MPISTNIFYVDDDPDDQLLFSEVVSEINGAGANLHLYQAENGSDFFELVNRVNVIPDITFLDINMPVKNGLECLEEIRADEKFQNRPVAMLSTSESKDVISKSYALGANTYIVKPSDFNDLRIAIERCLQAFNQVR